MSTLPAAYSNFILSLCAGVSTVTNTQPARPSKAERERRCRTLFEAELPTSAQGNEFADLYSADGLRITIRSLADVRHASWYATWRIQR